MPQSLRVFCMLCLQAAAGTAGAARWEGRVFHDMDGNGVADPYVIVSGETTTLWYAGFDGRVWAIGRATRGAGETTWKRDVDPVTGAFQSKLFGIARTFSGAGVRSPLLLDPEGSAEGDSSASNRSHGTTDIRTINEPT